MATKVGKGKGKQLQAEIVDHPLSRFEQECIAFTVEVATRAYSRTPEESIRLLGRFSSMALHILRDANTRGDIPEHVAQVVLQRLEQESVERAEYKAR